ncbi:3-hydroxyisobutyrate dehydrogenase [Pseudidiomarina indica]|uniref:3-hydroxyisobutyrate dehydrogenase n=1 Tax=Pseudidiomarina indica TaxID=1159017 RepID=A0A1G6AFR3_9GAMM|nr:3-hydroxyisobutyrate dehydrogenase [Pseudidiomarina indica]SDB07257.1 3-hydroxyisobutyrate dehydrogenase [Pseudidiomarina indica]
MAQVGFIGLGNMGGPMAANLVKGGHQVRVFDLLPAALEAAVAAGCDVAASAGAAAQDADFVITMLPADHHVQTVYLGEQGLVQQVAATALVIDCSTVSAATAQAVHEAFAARGVAFIDAPVSGGVGGAQAGTLTFICGGEASAVNRAHEVLTHMGKNIFHAGAAGAGQIAKICNNMLLSVLMVGTSEALQLGIAHGLDATVLSEIMAKSSGSNWTLDVYNPCPGVMEKAPASRDYEGGFLVDLMSKDLGLAQQAALASGAMTPMGALTHNLYRSWSALGHGRKDFSSIFKLLEAKQK